MEYYHSCLFQKVQDIFVILIRQVFDYCKLLRNAIQFDLYHPLNLSLSRVLLIQLLSHCFYEQ